MRIQFWSLALLLVSSTVASGACDRAQGSGAKERAVGSADCPALTAPGKLPTSVEEATAQKQKGASWSNEEIRGRYVCWVEGIGALNERWKAEGLSAEERSKRAYQARRDARLVSRAMMASGAEVAALQERDRKKYGNPDGPTYEGLVEKAKAKGLTGDAVYEEIVSSAQRTASESAGASERREAK